jgi:hypothetical protein
MNTRRLMIAIAVIALFFGGLVLLDRRKQFLRRAKKLWAPVYLTGPSRYNEWINHDFFLPNGRMKPEDDRMYDRMHAFYEELERKYWHAASHPWESVETNLKVPGTGPMADEYYRGYFLRDVD